MILTNENGMTQTTGFDSLLTPCPQTENDDVRDSGGDVMKREITSRQNMLNTGSASAIEKEATVTIHFSEPSHETQCSSEINFLCKSLELLRGRHGLVLALLAPILFSVQSLLVDVLTETIDSFQVVFMHVPILMMCCLVLIIYKGVRPSRNYKHYLWLMGSGTSQAGNTCFLALSMTYLAVGDTVTIMYTALIQVGFYSWLILKEPVRLFDIVFAILAFGGVIFIARPPFIFRTDAEVSLLGVLYALAGSCTIALFVVCNRKLSRLGVDSIFCIFFNATVAVLLSGLMSVILNRWRCPTVQEWLYALLAGVFYAFSHIALFYALKVETATLVTVISTIEIVYSYLWQAIFLRLLPFWTSYIGAILILAACIGITVKNKQPPSSAELSEVMGT